MHSEKTCLSNQAEKVGISGEQNHSTNCINVYNDNSSGRKFALQVLQTAAPTLFQLLFFWAEVLSICIQIMKRISHVFPAGLNESRNE